MNHLVVATASIVVVLAAALATPAVAEGGSVAGQKVFKKCKTCHTLAPGKKLVGPHLGQLFGRKAGTLEGFKYSKAMPESGIVWNEEILDSYLANPKKVVKGTTMVFAGLKKPKDRADLIAYLKQATQ